MNFSDMKFKSHPAGSGTLCQHFFPNGWGVSVITGADFPHEMNPISGA